MNLLTSQRFSFNALLQFVSRNTTHFLQAKTLIEAKNSEVLSRIDFHSWNCFDVFPDKLLALTELLTYIEPSGEIVIYEPPFLHIGDLTIDHSLFNVAGNGIIFLLGIFPDSKTYPVGLRIPFHFLKDFISSTYQVPDIGSLSTFIYANLVETANLGPHSFKVVFDYRMGRLLPNGWGLDLSDYSLR